MTDHVEDKDYEKYLDGESRVSRSYARLKELEPPETLDRAILDQARREAGKANGNWRASRWNRWLSSFSIAAVVTLALALVLRVELAPETQLTAPESSVSFLRQHKADSDLMELAAADEETAAFASGELNQVLSKETMAGGTAQADGGRAWDLPGERVDDDFASEPVAAAKMKAEFSGQTLMDSPARKPQAAQLARRETLASNEPQTLSSPSATIGSAAAESESDLDEARGRMLAKQSRADEKSDQANANGLAALRDNATIERQVFLQSVRDDPAFALQLYGTPDDWLKDIDLLLDDGRTDDARDELEVFKLAYPEFELKKRYTF